MPHWHILHTLQDIRFKNVPNNSTEMYIRDHGKRRDSIEDKRALADRTNGRAYATVLRLSVCLSSVRNVLWLNCAS